MDRCEAFACVAQRVECTRLDEGLDDASIAHVHLDLRYEVVEVGESAPRAPCLTDG